MNDTHLDIHRKHIELLREAGPERRAILASRLSNQARWRSMRGIADARPEFSDMERKLLFAQVHYGPDIERRLRAFLQEKGRLDER